MRGKAELFRSVVDIAGPDVSFVQTAVRNKFARRKTLGVGVMFIIFVQDCQAGVADALARGLRQGFNQETFGLHVSFK